MTIPPHIAEKYDFDAELFHISSNELYDILVNDAWTIGHLKMMVATIKYIIHRQAATLQHNGKPLSEALGSIPSLSHQMLSYRVASMELKNQIILALELLQQIAMLNGGPGTSQYGPQLLELQKWAQQKKEEAASAPPRKRRREPRKPRAPQKKEPSREKLKPIYERSEKEKTEKERIMEILEKNIPVPIEEPDTSRNSTGERSIPVLPRGYANSQNVQYPKFTASGYRTKSVQPQYKMMQIPKRWNPRQQETVVANRSGGFSKTIAPNPTEKTATSRDSSREWRISIKPENDQTNKIMQILKEARNEIDASSAYPEKSEQCNMGGILQSLKESVPMDSNGSNRDEPPNSESGNNQGCNPQQEVQVPIASSATVEDVSTKSDENKKNKPVPPKRSRSKRVQYVTSLALVNTGRNNQNGPSTSGSLPRGYVYSHNVQYPMYTASGYRTKFVQPQNVQYPMYTAYGYRTKFIQPQNINMMMRFPREIRYGESVPIGFGGNNPDGPSISGSLPLGYANSQNMQYPKSECVIGNSSKEPSISGSVIKQGENSPKQVQIVIGQSVPDASSAAVKDVPMRSDESKGGKSVMATNGNVIVAQQPSASTPVVHQFDDYQRFCIELAKNMDDMSKCDEKTQTFAAEIIKKIILGLPKEKQVTTSQFLILWNLLKQKTPDELAKTIQQPSTEQSSKDE